MNNCRKFLSVITLILLSSSFCSVQSSKRFDRPSQCHHHEHEKQGTIVPLHSLTTQATLRMLKLKEDKNQFRIFRSAINQLPTNFFLELAKSSLKTFDPQRLIKIEEDNHTIIKDDHSIIIEVKHPFNRNLIYESDGNKIVIKRNDTFLLQTDWPFYADRRLYLFEYEDVSIMLNKGALKQNLFFKQLESQELCNIYKATHPNIPQEYQVPEKIRSGDSFLLVFDFALESGNFDAALKALDICTIKKIPPLFSEDSYKYTPFDFILSYICNQMQLDGLTKKVIDLESVKTFDLYLDFIQKNKLQHKITGDTRQFVYDFTDHFFSGNKFEYLKTRMFQILFN